MNLAVDVGVELQRVGVRLVVKLTLSFVKYITARTHEAVVPVVIYEPLHINERNVLDFHAVGDAFRHALRVDGVILLLVRELYLEQLAVKPVVAAVAGLRLEAPHLDDTAQAVVARQEEVNVDILVAFLAALHIGLVILGVTL